MSNQNPDLYGVGRIRSGIKLYLISQILSLVFSIIFFLVIFGSILAGLSRAPVAGLAGIEADIIAALVLTIVVAVLEFLSLLRVRDGFSTLDSIGRDVGSGKTGTTLIFVSIILLVLGALLTLVIIGLFLVYIAEILFAVGTILLGFGFRQLGKIYNDSGTGTGGTLFFVGAILMFIPFVDIIGSILIIVGIILVYLGTGRIMNSLSGGMVPPASGFYGAVYPQQAPAYPQPMTQQNVIRGNGMAYVTIYSQFQANIVNSQIVGTSYSTSNISPNMLVQGVNNITINFNTQVSLNPGSTYVIRLLLSNGTSQDVSAVYRP